MTAAMLALGAIWALAAGCGGSKRVSATSTTGGAAGKREARAFARAVNLQAGDVPELTAVTSEREPPARPRGEEAAHCTGAEPRYRRLADVQSARFSGASATPQETVVSDVVVWPNAAMAERSAAAATSTRGRACAQHLLEREAIQSVTRRVRISHVSIAWLPPPLPRAKDSLAVRSKLTINAERPLAQAGPSSAVLEPRKVRHLTVPIVVDVLGFLSGRAVISLTAMSVKRPPPSATEHRLLSLLYSRATAHAQ